MKGKNNILLSVLAVALFTSCQPKFDCKEDYCGWIVVESTEDKTIISDGYKAYKEVEFPELYQYGLGDTICKTSSVTKIKIEVLKEKARMDAIIKAYE